MEELIQENQALTKLLEKRESEAVQINIFF